MAIKSWQNRFRKWAKKLIIAMCCTRNWYIYLATEMYALFKHNEVKKVYLFIEDDEIPYLKDKRIEFINVNKLPKYVLSTSPNYKTQYTQLSYLRCYFTKFIKYDKILYVDADAIVVDNIEELWNTPFDGNVIIGVKEPGEWSKHLNIPDMDDKYINSGVLLMNLKEIKEQGLDNKMLDLLNNKKFLFPDQDVINLVCKDKIKYVSNIYNSTETTGMVEDAKIIHYIRERKGWIRESPRSEIWYNYHKEMIGGNKVDNYKVKAIINFSDNENNGELRVAGKSEWNCSKDRYLFLKEHNAVELIEIEKVELPEAKIEYPEEPVKELKAEVKLEKPKKTKKTSKKTKNVV